MQRATSKSGSRQAVPKPVIVQPRGRNLLYLCLLVIAIVAAFAGVTSNLFTDYDDEVYITDNAHVRAGLTAATWSWAWTSTEAANWHPLTWISHAMDVSLFGMNPAGHHFMSLLIHALNALLLYLLLWRATGSTGRALAVAVLFGVHPLTVESVAWAAERKNVLCTLFFLLAIAAYGWYVRRPSAARYLLVALVFALGLAAKPMVITLPFVLLLLDFWPFGRVDGLSSSNLFFPAPRLSLTKAVIEKVPLLLLSMASAIVTLIAQGSAGALASTETLPIGVRIANAIYSYFDYIAHIFWPSALVPFYPQARLSAGQMVAAVLCLAAISAAAWLRRVSEPYLMIGWLFYLGTLVPVIGIVQVGQQAMADRYAYIPMLGVLVAFVWLVADFASAGHRQAARVALAAAVLVCIALTRRQVSLWHDDITLWSYNLEKTTNNPVAEDNLGIALLKQGRAEEALPHFYVATQLAPNDPISAANVGTDLLAHGQYREAIAKYDTVLSRAALVPKLLPNVHSNLGSAYFRLGDLDRAREHYTLALGLDPDDQVAQSGLRKIEQQSQAVSQ